MNPDDPITQDSQGYDEMCLWCGGGEEIISCDQCIHGFCHGCITHHFGANRVQEIIDNGNILNYLYF